MDLLDLKRIAAKMRDMGHDVDEDKVASLLSSMNLVEQPVLNLPDTQPEEQQLEVNDHEEKHGHWSIASSTLEDLLDCSVSSSNSSLR